MTSTSGLSIERVSSGYGRSKMLFDIDLSVGGGEVVSIMGRNGMGKSTLIKTIMGELSATSGRISYRGKEITGAKTHSIAQTALAGCRKVAGFLQA